MPLRRPLAVPYMAFAVGLPIAVATVLVLIASVGYGSPCCSKRICWPRSRDR
jgi:hypothetical protein